MWPRFKSRHRRHMWVEFVVGSLPCSERFFSGYSGFPLSSKTNISKFQFDQEPGRRRTTRWICYLQIFIIIISSSSSIISTQFRSISKAHLNNLLKTMRERMLKWPLLFFPLLFKIGLQANFLAPLAIVQREREFVLPPPPHPRPSRIEERKI